MALYHLTAKTGTRATGHSALAKAQYIQREDRYARVPDALVYTTSGNLPSFAEGDPAAYWDAADLYERANGRLFKEVEFALPVELAAADQQALAESFAKELLAGETLPYTLAIHEGRGHNPHCHVLVSERVNDGVERPAHQWFRRWNASDPERGGARKSEALKPREWLETIRQKWADFVNRALERAGFRERVDHRSLAAQGEARTPQIHLGPNVIRMEERGLGTDRGDESERIAARNRTLEPRTPPNPGTATSAQQGDGTRSSADPSLSASSRPIERSTPRSGSEPALAPGVGHASEERSPTEPRSESRREATTAREREASIRTDELDGRAPVDLAIRELERQSGEPRGASLTTSAREDVAGSQLSVERMPASTEPNSSAPSGGATASRGSDADPRPNSVHAAGQAEPIDRTARAVDRQLLALGCARFEVGIFERTSSHMMNRTWSREEVLGNLPALKRMNAQGSDIYVRPAESTRHGLVLLDDLKSPALARMERDGRGPAAIVETSPGNYQAWVRVPPRASAAERGAIARRLAQEYDGDRGSASARQYGRLAGFTNRKEEHCSPEGLQPFALLRRASGRAAPDGELLLRQAQRALRGAPGAPEQRSPNRSPPPAASADGSRQREATQLYRTALAEARQQTADLSRCDFAAAVRLAAHGYGRATIRQAVREASPDLAERKRGHVEDYVRRTAEAAIRFHERQQGRGRDGPER